MPLLLHTEKRIRKSLIFTIMSITMKFLYGQYLKFSLWATIDMREKVSRAIGINLSSDTYRELLYKYVYALKDLRNAIAHNDVVYDTRFKKMDPSRPMKQCLILEMGMPYINFKTIGDYIILICYYLKLLKVSKTEIKSFIREFEKITREYESSVNPNVSAITIHPDLFSRLNILKNSI